VPYLLAVRGQQLVSLVQAEPAELSAVVTGLVTAADHRLMAGGGRPIHELGGASSSLNDAQMAVQELVLHGSGGLRLFEDLGVAAWLVGVPPPSELRTKVDTVLGELLLEPDLYETLVVFLRHHARVAATARAMSLHENSLRYRLGRIEARLGCSLREVPTLVDLYLATLAVGAGQEATSAPGAAAGGR
jgi:purine catabolism regulator